MSAVLISMEGDAVDAFLCLLARERVFPSLEIEVAANTFKGVFTSQNIEKIKSVLPKEAWVNRLPEPLRACV